MFARMWQKIHIVTSQVVTGMRMCWPKTYASIAQNTLCVPNRHIHKRQTRFKMHVFVNCGPPLQLGKVLASATLQSCSCICTQADASRARS